MSGKRQNSRFALILILLSILCFIVMAPGTAHFWYKQGAGHAIADLIDSGADIEIAKPKARISGIVYATLMVLGQHFSMLVLFCVTVGILTKATSTDIKKKLRFVFGCVCLVGGICLGLAQGMIQTNARWFSCLGSALLMWLVIGMICGGAILIVSRIRRFLKRSSVKAG